jgi:WhiB family transcriptional regulator, redox-sensing transcriptional regulator
MTDWQNEAACAQIGGDLWFPLDGDRHQAERAKTICATCPVRIECANHALENDERFGIWGGYTPNELAKLRRRRTA